MKTPLIPLLAGLSILLFVSQNEALACPVCFGALDDPSTNGMSYAILTLLFVTGTVLSSIVAFFLRLRKLSRSLAAREVEG